MGNYSGIPIELMGKQVEEGFNSLDWAANFFNEDDLNIASGELMQAKSFLDSNKYLDTDSMEPDQITEFINKKKDAEEIIHNDQTKRMERLNGMMRKIVKYLDSTERIADAMEDIGKNIKLLTEAVALGPATLTVEQTCKDFDALQAKMCKRKRKNSFAAREECEDNNNGPERYKIY